jgi:hypothetical protein
MACAISSKLGRALRHNGSYVSLQQGGRARLVRACNWKRFAFPYAFENESQAC